MKKNRLVLPVLIVLLVLITPCAIYGTYNVVAKKIAGENPKHLHKLNGKLYYYDTNDNLIGSYECKTDDCDTASSVVDDEYLNYTDGFDYSLDTFASYAIIKDGDDTFIYSLSSNKNIVQLLSVKTYGKKLNSKFLIVQETEGYYGLFNTEFANYNIHTSEKYEYLGIASRFLNEDEETMILAAKKDGGYFIVDAKNVVKSSVYDYPIYDYDYRYVLCINNGRYLMYDYQKNSVLSYYGFDKASLYYDNYITLENNQINIYKTDITNLVKTFSYPGRVIDYEIIDNVLTIKDGETVIDSYEFILEP